MNFDPNKPYNNLPPLPPKKDLETRDVLKLCIAASRALEGLRQIGKTIPNQAVLINTIPLLEAQASSEIENIVTTTDRLFRFADSNLRNADPATREALCYGRALREGGEIMRRKPLCTATAVQVCRTIKSADIDIRKIPGTALANQSTGEVIYTPPVGEALLREKLANWERFLHEYENMDPLIRMAAAHYQFEAIHPFTDGNGRTGRILNILYLVGEKLLDVPVLYLSSYLIRHKADYYRLLLEVTTTENWHAWLIFMLTALEETARWTRDRVAAIRDLHQATTDFVSRRHQKFYTFELVQQLFIQPYVRIGYLVDSKIAHRETASKYLKDLCGSGVLEEHKEGRDKLFLNVRLLELLRSRGNNFRGF